jgi:uncharacterized membrane protein YwaF
MLKFIRARAKFLKQLSFLKLALRLFSTALDTRHNRLLFKLCDTLYILESFSFLCHEESSMYFFVK